MKIVRSRKAKHATRRDILQLLLIVPSRKSLKDELAGLAAPLWGLG